MKYKLRDFVPLIIIVGVVVLFTATAIFLHGGWEARFAMQMFMAGFFLVFGFFKIINLNGFVTAYQKYDIVTKQSRAYGYLYPFIELALGVAYLFGWQLLITNWVTLVVMSVGAIGVLQKLLQREEIPCACLGVVFKIPMTWVTFVEDVLMATMAFIMIVSAQSVAPMDTLPYAEARFGSEIVQLEIVDTPLLRQKGLSGREKLSKDTGMLFVFSESDHYGIWMKEMLFDIDIIWLDEENKVVHIVEEATPESFPMIFRPPALSTFVIEATSGFVKDYEVKIGDVLNVSTS